MRIKGIDFPPKPPKSDVSISQEGFDDIAGAGAGSDDGLDPEVARILNAPRTLKEESDHARAIVKSREQSTEGKSLRELDADAQAALRKPVDAPEGSKSIREENDEMLAGLGLVKTVGKKARGKKPSKKKGDVPVASDERVSALYDGLGDESQGMPDIDAMQAPDGPAQEASATLRELRDALNEDTKLNDSLTDRTRSLLQLNLADARDYLTHVRARLFKLDATQIQKEEFSKIEEHIVSAATRIESALSSLESAQAMSSLFEDLNSNLNELSRWNVSISDDSAVSSAEEGVLDGSRGGRLNDVARRAGASQPEIVISAREQKRIKAEKMRESTRDDLRVTPEDATAAETRAALKAGVEELTVRARLAQWAEKAGSAKEFYQDSPELVAQVEWSRTNYFQALRAHQHNRSIFSALPERLGATTADDDKGTERLRELKKAWVQDRANIARARLDSVTTRRDARDESPKVHGGLTREVLEANQVTEEKRRQDLWDSMTAQERETARENTPREDWAQAGISIERQKTRERGTDAVQARYQRMYVLKEAAFGAAEEENKVRMEALNSRDKNLVEGIFKWYQDLPPKRKIAISGVGLAAGTFAAYGAITGVSLVAGIAMVPILAGTAASMAMRWRADNLRIEAEKARALGMHETEEGREKISRIEAAQASLQKNAQKFTFSGLGGLITNIFTKKALTGKRNKADSTLAQRDSAGNIGGAFEGSAADAEALAGLTRTLDTAHGKKSQADAVEGTVTFAGSLVGGLAGGAISGEIVHHGIEPGVQYVGEHTAPAMHSVQEQFNHLLHRGDSPAETATADTTPATSADALKIVVDKTPGADSATTTETAQTADTASAASAVAHPVAPEGMVTSAEVGSGEGFGQLLVNLRQALSPDASPELQQLLNTNPNELAHQIHAADASSSLEMKPGDTLFVDKHQDVWFKAEGKEPELAFKHIDATPGSPAHYEAQIIHGNMQPNGGEDVAPAPEARAEVAPPASAPAPEAPVASVSVDSGVVPSGEQLVPAPVMSGEGVAPMTQLAGKLDTEVPVPPQAPASAPVEHGPSIPAPEQVAVGPDAPLINANGVDLHKPALLWDKDHNLFARATNPETGAIDPKASYDLLVAKGQELPPGTPIFMISMQPNALGVLVEQVIGFKFLAGNPTPQPIPSFGASLDVPKPDEYFSPNSK